MKSQQNEGICGSTERSEVLLDVLSVMLTLQFPPEAVNKSGCKAGFEVGIGLCSPIPTTTKLYGSVLTSILGPPSFVSSGASAARSAARSGVEFKFFFC